MVEAGGQPELEGGTGCRGRRKEGNRAQGLTRSAECGAAEPLRTDTTSLTFQEQVCHSRAGNTAGFWGRNHRFSLGHVWP